MSDPVALLGQLRALSLSPQTEALFASIRRFMHWWGSELQDLLPARLRAFLWKQPDRLFIDVSEETLTIWRDGSEYAGGLTRVVARASGNDSPETEADRASEIRLLTDHATHRILKIPADVALISSLSLPPVRASQVRALLSFELLRISPIDPSLVYFGFRTVDPNHRKAKTLVEICIVKKSAIDSRLQRLRQLGLEPTDVIVDGGDQEQSYFDYTREVLPKPRTPFHRRMERVLAILGLALLVGGISVEFSNNQSHRSALEAAIVQEKKTAREFDVLQSQIKTEEEILEVIPARKRAPRILDLLAEVTHRLPDDTWLFQLQLSSKEGRADGYSPAAYSLIDAFAASPLIVNPRFKASVTEGPTRNLQRFDLAFDTKPRGGG